MLSFFGSKPFLWFPFELHLVPTSSLRFPFTKNPSKKPPPMARMTNSTTNATCRLLKREDLKSIDDTEEASRNFELVRNEFIFCRIRQQEEKLALVERNLFQQKSRGLWSSNLKRRNLSFWDVIIYFTSNVIDLQSAVIWRDLLNEASHQFGPRLNPLFILLRALV